MQQSQRPGSKNLPTLAQGQKHFTVHSSLENMASKETSLARSTAKKVTVQVSRHDIEFLVGDLVPII
jgi:hypothetical protein